MFISARLLLRLAVPVSAALLSCSSPEPETLSCQVSAECPTGTWCISGGCVANSSPTPVVALPAGELQANLLQAFDGSSSADPDPGDAVVSFAWAFRSVDAPCDPPLVAGAGPVATVRFACPGRYELELRAVDRTGAAGATTVELAVAPYAGPELVVAAPDVAVDHACTSSPLRCAPAQSVALGASAPGSAPGEVSFTWTVEAPPERPLDGTRRVTFLPGPSVAGPVVDLETDGTAISGDWVFRVVASDAAGVLGTAAMRVSVGNRPPVVSGAAPQPAPHRFLGDRFEATGEIPVAASDPDGDPLVQRSVLWRHAGDGPGGVFDGVDRLDSLTFAISVPYTTPADGLFLLDGAGLERSIELAVSDVNGARTAATWAVAVANRSPVLSSTPAPFTVDHQFDPARVEYRATAPLSTFTDPDGDPLLPVPGASTGDPLCSIAVTAGGSVRAECALAFSGAAAVANFAGVHAVTQRVQDPWVAAAPVTASFTIGNYPPTITSSETFVATEACVESGACCGGPLNDCLLYWSSAPAGMAVMPSRWADPDGDPLDVQVTASGAVTPVQPLVCTPAACALLLQVSEASLCGWSTTIHATTITDGLASVTGTLAVRRQCY